MPFKKTFDLTTRGQAASRQPTAEAIDMSPDAVLAIESLPEKVQAGVRAMGWPGLMPVQVHAIPPMLEKRDLIVQSRTGSGKTGAFLLPMLEHLDPDIKATQALVLSPTRELAKQIYGEFDRMNTARSEGEQLRGVAVYGGVGYGPQIDAFKKGAQMVVGTPGRILDHLEHGALRLEHLRFLILDEADEMLSMGFYPAMRQLKRYLPKERASYMFSATMPSKVQRIGEEFLTDPAFLAIGGADVQVELMTHRYYRCDPMEKDRVLVRLIEMENPEAAIIFANTKREVEYLATMLRNFGYDAAGLSSDLSQADREKVMGRLRTSSLRLLVATDVAARGIDVSDLSHVFQYDVPKDREYYVHRAGRTARAGKAGVAITLATPQEEPILIEIGGRYDIFLEKRDAPTDSEVSARVGERVTVLLEGELRERTRLERERAARFEPLVRQLVEDGEPELLALLLDRVYQKSLQRGVEVPADPGTPEFEDDDLEEGEE